MSSTLNSISAKTATPPAKITGKRETDSYTLAAADSLLKTTGQWKKWEKIRQTNDALAKNLASLLMERHYFLNQAKSGKKINWEKFNLLTAKLSSKGIHLWDKNALLNSGWEKRNNLNINSYPDPDKTNPVNNQILKSKKPENEVHPRILAPIPPLYLEKHQDLGKSENKISNKKPGFFQPNQPLTAPLKTMEEKNKKSPETSEIKNPEPKKTNLSPITIAELDNNPPPPGEIDYLILDARWERYLLASGFGAYGSPDKLFMPLGSLAAISELPLRVNLNLGKVEGEVLGKKFNLDLNKNSLELGNEKIEVPKNAYLKDEDDIYIDTEILKNWLPLDFDFSFQNMRVDFKPREKLPFQERIERQQKWGTLSSQRGRTGPSILEEKTKPDFISLPVTDLSVSATHDTRAYKRNKANYTLSGAGNLANATSYFYATGDDEDYLNRVQARIEKTDIEGNLPFGATKIAAGDVKTAGKGKIEQGIMLDTRPLYRPTDFDKTRFEGNLEPGWEVELYRGSTLINVYKVKEDGHYLFEDIDVYYGNNPFRLEFFGPEGQKYVEDKSFEIGSDMLPKNSLHYSGSITRQDTITYQNRYYEDEDFGNLRAEGIVEYGLGPKTSLFGGFTSDTDEGERRNRINSGLSQSLNHAYLRFEGIKDIEDQGSGLKASLQTAIGDTKIKASHSFENKLEDDKVINRTRASISGNLGIKEKLDLPYTLSADYTDREDGYYSRISLLNSLKTGQVYWSNSMDWTYDSKKEDPESIDGRLSASSYLKKVSLRAYGNYTYDDKDNGLTDAGIRASKMLKPNLRGELGLNKSFTNDEITRMDARINWKYKDLTITPRISGDDKGNWDASINIKLNTSLGMEPHKKSIRSMDGLSNYTGHASVRVFEDKNLNGILDENEKGIENVKIKSLQSGTNSKTDKDGIAVLPLFAHRKTDLVIDESSLEDPSLYPSGPGEAVTPRPGDIRALNFPVIRTGEVDGTIYRVDLSGKSIILKQVEVLLKNEEGEVEDRVLSQFDGFYLFEKVKPGNYTIEAVWTDNNGEKIRKSKKAKIDKTGSIAYGIDLIMKNEKEKTKIIETKPAPLSIKKEKLTLFNKGNWEIGKDETQPSEKKAEFKPKKIVLYEHGGWVLESIDTRKPKPEFKNSKPKILKNI